MLVIIPRGDELVPDLASGGIFISLIKSLFIKTMITYRNNAGVTNQV